MSEDDIEQAANERAAAHGDNRSPRMDPLDPNAEERLGVRGESNFATLFGLDWVKGGLGGKGDGGVDFSVPMKGGRVLTIDVKLNSKPEHLLVKANEIGPGRGADVYVLAQKDFEVTSYLGWEHRSVMALMPKRDFGAGVPSHYRLRAQLRPMDQLLDILAMRAPRSEG